MDKGIHFCPRCEIKVMATKDGLCPRCHIELSSSSHFIRGDGQRLSQNFLKPNDKNLGDSYSLASAGQNALTEQYVASASQDVRADFIRRTYRHLAFAVLGFIAIEYLLLNSPMAPAMASLMTGGYAWLVVLAAFMGVSYIADRWARSTTSVQTQYLGLIVYVVAEAIIFLPLLLIASMIAPQVIPHAGLITLALFGGLTYTAFTTKKDFSFLGGILKIGFFVAMGLIVASILLGFTLGLLFSGAMMVFAAVAILYSTSNVLRQYRPEQHVAAALSLFAAVALLFWYVVQFLLHFAGDD